MGQNEGMPLPQPSRFTPWANGSYSVAPGLRGLGTDFGNEEADGKLILLDRDFARYRNNKVECLREARARHWLTSNLDPQSTHAVFERTAMKLAEEYPEQFHWSDSILECGLTGEKIHEEGGVLGPRSSIVAGVTHPLEALAMQIQPDLAVIQRDSDRDWVSALHLCAPSSWSPEEKIGKPFFDIHVPVPGFEKVNAVSRKFVDALIQQGPFVRFVWGVSSDGELNHHPQVATDPGRFDLGRFWVRVERQSTLGLPEVNAAIFFIHVQTIPDTWVLKRHDLKEALVRGLKSMSHEARIYKSVDRYFYKLMDLLGDK